MPRLHRSRRLPAFTSLLALGALVALWVSLRSPSDPKNAILFGYSLERILLGGGILILALALLFLTWNLSRHPETSTRLWQTLTMRGMPSDALFFISVTLFLASWVILLLPSYRLGGLAGYVERLTPLIGWLAGLGAAGSAVILWERKTQRQIQIFDGVILKVASISFGVLLFLMGIILATGLGVFYTEDYWYGVGVPVLGLQVLGVMLAGAAVLLFEKRLRVFEKKPIDRLIFIGIWVLAAWFWAREPLSPNYFMPDTADNIIYPYSDGATFDTGAQFALIGQGIFNGVFFERALYSIFLTYLHLFAGQDFHVLMTAQAAIFAVLPALVYLIGREMHSRALGISAGLLAAVRGLNAIVAAKWIDTASPKMALTDFPTAIGIALLLLLVVKWLKQPNRPAWMVWVGAVFVLAFMVRTNVLTLLPIIFLCLPFFTRITWKRFVLAGLLALLGVLTVTLPWELRNQSRGIPMYSMYYSRIITILRSRYNLGVETNSYLPQLTSLADARNSGIRQRVTNLQAGYSCNSALCSIPNHFLHNGVTSFVALPTSLIFDDLWNTIKADTPFWKKTWNEGSISPVGWVLIVVNLGLVALGVAAIWSRIKRLALLPVLIFGTYIFTNALGLTSGGRYIAPVDWIIHLYFVAGGLQLVTWTLKSADFPISDDTPSETSHDFPPLASETFYRLFPVLGLILLTGSLMPLSEAFFQPRYQVQSPQAIISRLEETGLLARSGYTQDELLTFLSQPNTIIREGRALYPRYYPAGEGEQDRSTYFRYLDFQRLVFTLISPYSSGAEGVVIPGLVPPDSFHAGDVVTLGCYNTAYYAPYIDAVVVFYTSGNGFVYLREPSAPLQCPLPEPK